MGRCTSPARGRTWCSRPIPPARCSTSVASPGGSGRTIRSTGERPPPYSGPMRIEFGWSLDGAAWADGGGAAGIARLGPRGLVQLLQGRLGLTRPAVEPAVRVAQYLRLLEEHPQPWPAR